MMQDFTQVLVWQMAHGLTLEIYQATAAFPKEELYGLTSQIRRASASIPMNIAEGCGRESRLEFIHFLQISLGSASEVEYQLLLAKDLGWLSSTQYEDLCRKTVELKRMLTGLIKQVRSKLVKTSPQPSS